ncbi:MAG TPA: GTP cyclohydrolase II [Noviherbaspirillum sp.]|uniref:GTP cyclohydrolase II n=1 Tax=Noviherbaspirillum sp. TaxID=1926288 RepID=UPI002B4A4B6D|nr:GTP cyclohydrolase II [Noviherbaspirillum sp.]HJV86503.1 GTP cyclohydrolase II [Noviherbaspirillum sp.]
MTLPSTDAKLNLHAVCRLPTTWGEFQLHGFIDDDTGREHVALTMGHIADGAPVLTRVHSECLTGDGFFSRRCDCGPQLAAGMQAIAAEGRGVLLYLRQEGRGIGLFNKIRAYALQDQGADTVDANRMLGLPDDMREYTMVHTMLGLLGVSTVRLITNNPAKIEALRRLGIIVSERIALHVGRNTDNARYLDTKMRRMGHLADQHLESDPAVAPL